MDKIIIFFIADNLFVKTTVLYFCLLLLLNRIPYILCNFFLPQLIDKTKKVGCPQLCLCVPHYCYYVDKCCEMHEVLLHNVKFETDCTSSRTSKKHTCHDSKS